MKVHAPMWFIIKNNSSIKYGARHLWSSIHKSRYLSDELELIVDPVIQRNAFFSHPENILLSIITDDRKAVRELKMGRILHARPVKYRIRECCVPILNFNA